MSIPTMMRASFTLALAWGLVVGIAPCLAAQRDDAGSPLRRPALLTPQANKAALLGAAHAGTRLVLAGERGVVLLSDDQGRHWRQAPTPVSVTLTAVRFVNERRGWATGHAGVVLSTEDGGATWCLRLDGIQAAHLAQQAARARSQDAAHRAASVAEQLVQDGADKPFLDLHFTDANHGFVVGAYGLFFFTDDGGRTWSSGMDQIDNPRSLHLNAIAGRGQQVVIVGEQGMVLRSTDAGHHFVRVSTPMRSTLFAVDVAPDGTTLVAGLGGKAMFSSPQGTDWIPVQMPTTSAIVALLHDGDRWTAGDEKGRLFESRDAGRTFVSTGLRADAPLSAIVSAGDGTLVVAGPQGMRRIARPGNTP